MAGKLQLVSEMARMTAEEITEGKENWKKYMDTAARLNMFSFDEQLLIYAQRPGASACASLEQWNGSMNRWVKRGAKGIALIHKNGKGRRYLEYVFDVTDTRPVRGAKEPYIWEIRDDRREEVISALETRYGRVEGVTFHEKLTAVADAAVREWYGEGYAGSGGERDGFQDVLTASVKYMLLARCKGKEAFTEDETLDKIRDFSEPEALYHLGDAVSSVSRDILLEIRKVILRLDRGMSENRSKKVENALAITDEGQYNKNIEEFNTLIRESTGGEENGRTDIQEERRLSDPESDSGRGADGERGGDDREVRPDAGELPSGSPARRLHRDASDGYADTTSVRDRQTGGRSGGADGAEDDERAGSRRGAESIGSDAVGTEGQRADSDGRGDSASGDRISVSRQQGVLADTNRAEAAGEKPAVSASKEERFFQLSLFPTVEEQIADITAKLESEKISVNLTEAVTEDVIEKVLTCGGNHDGSILHVVAFFQGKKTETSAAEMLKEEYGEGFKGISVDGRPYAVSLGEEGFRIAPGRRITEENSTLVTWERAGEIIEKLLAEGRYASKDTLDAAWDNEYHEMADKIWYMRQDLTREAAEKGYLPEIERLYRGCGYFESTQKIEERLRDQDGRAVILSEIENFVRLYADDKNLMRSHRYAPRKVYDRCVRLDAVPKVFPFNADFKPVSGSFITDDEIDILLTDRMASVVSKLRFYARFMQGHDRAEQVKMIKDVYGFSSVEMENERIQSDDKGIRFTRYDDISGYRGYDTVKLSWVEVEARIETMIREGRYLTPQEKAYLPEYEKKWLAENVYTFYYNAGQKPGGFGWDVERGGKEFRPLLEDKKHLEALHQDMAEVFAKLPTDGSVRQYQMLKETLEDVDALRKGEYSLYKPRPISGPSEEKAEEQQKERENEQEAESSQREQASEEKHNFRISDGPFRNPKTRYQSNAAAIRLLKQIEEDGRLASPGEQEVLARFTGWGGLTQVFDPENKEWAEAYTQLKGLLTEKEYEAARSSILSAYYTDTTVIGAVYDAVERMGIVPGSVLEPACGVGNYFGLLPEKFENARLYGVELDSISGRIAKQLYQNADISLCGFEETAFSDDLFDLAVGNVPFGEYGVHDKRYDREGLLIHDYFIIKTLDKLRPGGIAAVITSRGTMDKGNPAARELMAQKAELLGAIRLPNNAFSHSGTEVTTDILFFQKLDREPLQKPEWTKTAEISEGILINSYFAEHPEMMLGEMVLTTTRYGQDATCRAFEGEDLKDKLSEAVGRLAVPRQELLLSVRAEGSEAVTDIPADAQVRNYSFAKKDGKLYFRENSRMRLVETGKTQTGRIMGMMDIRDCARELIEMQMQGADDDTVEAAQRQLSMLYDRFQKQYGLLNSTGNRLVFRQDSSYPLLCSLEILDEEGNFERKADIFTKRTIQYRKPVTHADTAVEALGISIGERACVDLGFMAALMGGIEKIPQIVSDLKGIIFKTPESGPFDLAADWDKGWQTADEYLSGNVRKKLETARAAAETNPEFAVNVDALTKVQPKDLSASEISVRLGAPWVDIKYYKQFMYEVFQTPGKYRNEKMITIKYSDVSGEWYVSGKSMDTLNSLVSSTYGTKRINGYAILEATLNQRSIQIYDTETDADGKETRVLNQKETVIAQQKQDALKDAFQNWIFKDADRRVDLCSTYNRLYNSVVPRSYDGSHIVFSGMNPEIALEVHQKNAVARILYGKNTLLAHVVGAGKTYTMTAGAMESKRLGLCRKSMFVVPNHLTEQWGSEFLRLYPGAKVLVTANKDFEKLNRRKFCAKIATGDYDAVVIGHSQFEKIPLSIERQKATIERQIAEIMADLRATDRQDKYMIRQLERTKKGLEQNLKRLADIDQDDTVTFEELGVDRLFVDEAHAYKNLFLYTKMRNVAGISQTAAKKSSDMFAKCRYMDEKTGGKGVVFATGTPVSNSMVELYTMMRYLQYDMLEEGFEDSTGQRHSLKHFDNWATTFGEQVTAVELKPEGTGFRLKTRFARFYNLPELMNLWKEVADIQTADMLNLPVPEAEYITIQTDASEAQKQMVQALAERAERIRTERLDPSIDNMLKVTSDGRKLALDQRIINPLLADEPGSKVNTCVSNAFQIWQDTAAEKSTQLIFSDLSTPKGRTEPKRNKAEEDERGDGESENTAEEISLMSSVYEDIRDKLVAKGVPREEVAFIHDAKTEVQKAELFAKVRSGKVRVLLGSTQKMGAGTNVQKKLIALHDLDCPWRPADLEQRSGRIVRRGNDNKKVRIFRYVTKGTFDAYTWGLVESKQRFIGQIMTSKSPVRSAEDVDATALSYAEVKMLAAGDPRIKEKMDLDIQVTRLKLLKANHQSQQYDLQDKVRSYYPRRIKETNLYIDCLKADLPRLNENPVREDLFKMVVMGKSYTERKKAGEAVTQACRNIVHRDMEIELGEYRGFPMRLGFDGLNFEITMKGHLTYTAKISEDALGNVTRINNVLEKIPQKLAEYRENLEQLKKELGSAEEEAARPFPHERELAEKTERLALLNGQLEYEGKETGQESLKETLAACKVQAAMTKTDGKKEKEREAVL